MFKPHLNTCSNCKQETIVVVKKMLCAKCNYEQKQAKKKSEGKKTGPYRYNRKATGEKDVFHSVLDNLPDDQETKCFICRDRISVITPSNFAHVLSKKKYPLFRNNPDNIRILCHKIIADEAGGQGCHYAWDFKPRSELKGDNWERMFKLEEELKEQYKKLENDLNLRP